MNDLDRMTFEFERVSDSRVALQRVAKLQAIIEHACHQGTLILARRLAFDERRESHDLRGPKVDRGTLQPRGIQRLPHRAKILNHAPHGLLASGVTREFVGRRKQESFEALRVRS